MGYEPFFFPSSGKANKNENMNIMFKGFPFFRDSAEIHRFEKSSRFREAEQNILPKISESSEREQEIQGTGPRGQKCSHDA